VIYLLSPTDAAWWLTGFLIVPLILLAEWRHEQKGFSGGAVGSGDPGAWAPPVDGGGGG
jgi:hypothetical protein